MLDGIDSTLLLLSNLILYGYFIAIHAVELPRTRTRVRNEVVVPSPAVTCIVAGE